MPSGLEIIDAFEQEIAASPEYKTALAGDPEWSERLDTMFATLRALYHRADDDARALDLCDRALEAIQSPQRMKLRALAVQDALSAAVNCFVQLN